MEVGSKANRLGREWQTLLDELDMLVGHANDVPYCKYRLSYFWPRLEKAALREVRRRAKEVGPLTGGSVGSEQ